MLVPRSIPGNLRGIFGDHELLGRGKLEVWLMRSSCFPQHQRWCRAKALARTSQVLGRTIGEMAISAAVSAVLDVCSNEVDSVTNQTVQMQPTVKLTVFARTDVGRIRQNNEDAFVVADLNGSPALHEMQKPALLSVGERGVLLAVSDGMGGRQAGEVASALALQSLRKGMLEGEANNAEEVLRASVEQANEKVWTAAHEQGRRGMGATLTAVLFHGTRAYVAEIGDSRAYLLRGGRLVQLTHDQSYVQLLVDAGTLTREEAQYSEYKNIILQAVGTQPDLIVALNRFRLRRYDQLLLCSDGLSNQLEHDEIQSILMTSPNVDVACRKLVDMANERGGEDNITAMVAHVDGDSLPEPEGDPRVSLETIQAFRG
jgi:serine/threonine protein phosphatase PrpC